MKARIRRLGSIKNELLNKSREASLAAVQIFNNPNITFKSETYIVLMIISWTYLLHAYYRQKQIDYRYTTKKGSRLSIDKTKHGAGKHWELERCLNDTRSPIDKNAANNLRFLIGLRNEIEHKMTSRIDEILSARFQACCLNYNQYIKKLFGTKYCIEKHLSFSLQFSTLSTDQRKLLKEYPDLPKNIQAYISNFDNKLTNDEYSNQSYAYRILFVPKTANTKGQADRVIEFVKSDSPLADKVNIEYTMIKEIEKPKYLPNQVVAIMKTEGFLNFSINKHAELWRDKDAKNPSKGYGTLVAGKHWHWYENWLEEVRRHCNSNKEIYV